MVMIVNAEEAQGLYGQLKRWAYNALDCTGTREIADVLLPRLNPKTERTYAFERACQSPAFAIMRRGVLIDEVKRDRVVTQLKRELKKAITELNKDPLLNVWDATEIDSGMCPKSTRKDGRHKWPRGIPDAERSCETCGTTRLKRKPFNPISSDQCQHLFYDLYGITPMRNKTGEVSCDKEILQRIGRKSPKFADLTDKIIECKDIKKQVGFLNAKLSANGRFMSSANVGKAWTGRWSASKNPYQEGSNLQNIAERHRNIFLADPGYEIFYADLERAESMTVAYVAGDPAYIEAHSTDTHTFVARLLWPELPWTGDIAKDKKVAQASPEWDQAPGHNWRFQAKRIQHGSNYGLSPRGISMIAHIPLREAERAYDAYFEAFPGIRAWQKTIRAKVENQETLENPLGRTCRLFGRPWDPHTYKQGLAFIPQSTVADVLNLSLWHVWNKYDPDKVQLLGQVHDAILGQWRIEQRAEASRAVVETMTIPIKINEERTMTIPVEISCGLNWGKASEANPKGQKTLEI